MKTDLSINRRTFAIALGAVSLGIETHAQIQPSSADERGADEQAFAPIAAGLASRWTDVESVCILLKGRIAFEFYRSGDAQTLRNVQSVEKSALSALVGVAIAKGLIANVDQSVVALVPEWASLNDDPRSRTITVRHLLTMTAGFDIGSATSTSGKMAPERGWARPMTSAPGERYVYDNAIVVLAGALIEKVAGMRLPDFARRELVEPLGMAEPAYRNLLHLRTQDMARLGQLFLQEGRWQDRQVIPRDYAIEATRPQNKGGPPASMPYGFFWWILPNEAPRRTFLASGYAGQLVWVHPPLDLVVAGTSTISADSQRRGHAVNMLGSVVEAATKRHPR